MKHLILALALLVGGEPNWHERTEPLVGFVCPSAHSAERVASIGVGYALRSTLESANCVFMAFNGTRVGESADFNIGDTIFSFSTVRVDGGTVYLLNNKGQGYIT